MKENIYLVYIYMKSLVCRYCRSRQEAGEPTILQLIFEYVPILKHTWYIYDLFAEYEDTHRDA